VRQWKLSEQNFDIFIERGRFALADFGHDPSSSDRQADPRVALPHAHCVVQLINWRPTTVASRNFVFLSGKQRTISRQPNFTKFEHNTAIGVTMKTFGIEF